MKIKLSEIGGAKLSIIKAIKDLTGMGLKESKDVVDSVADGIPQVLSFNSVDKAKRAVSALTEVGCSAAYVASTWSAALDQSNKLNKKIKDKKGSIDLILKESDESLKELEILDTKIKEIKENLNILINKEKIIITYIEEKRDLYLKKINSIISAYETKVVSDISEKLSGVKILLSESPQELFHDFFIKAKYDITSHQQNVEVSNARYQFGCGLSVVLYFLAYFIFGDTDALQVIIGILFIGNIYLWLRARYIHRGRSIIKMFDGTRTYTEPEFDFTQDNIAQALKEVDKTFDFTHFPRLSKLYERIELAKICIKNNTKYDELLDEIKNLKQ